MSEVDDQGRTRIEQLEEALEQACHDLNEAHDSILRTQGVPDEVVRRHDWPKWTPQAHTIHWAERILEKRLAKTKAWTNYPDLDIGEPAKDA